MGKIPQSLREIIGKNIRECRMKKYPGHGGAKKCAEALGVSPQQWSPWEKGDRTPDEARLEEIAKFFGVTTEFLRRDNNPNPDSPSTPPPTFAPGRPRESSPQTVGVSIPHSFSVPETIIALHSMRLKAVYEVEICIKNVKYIPADD